MAHVTSDIMAKSVIDLFHRVLYSGVGFCNRSFWKFRQFFIPWSHQQLHLQTGWSSPYQLHVTVVRLNFFTFTYCSTRNIRPSVDGLYRDGTVHISREMHKQCFSLLFHSFFIICHPLYPPSFRRNDFYTCSNTCGPKCKRAFLNAVSAQSPNFLADYC